jgi:hypothetical protein
MIGYSNRFDLAIAHKEIILTNKKYTMFTDEWKEFEVWHDGQKYIGKMTECEMKCLPKFDEKYFEVIKRLLK